MRTLLREEAERPRFRRNIRVPEYFDYDPAPLRVTKSVASVTIGTWATTEVMEFTLFDFGAISAMFRIPLSGTLVDLVALSEEFYDHATLAAEARRHASDLVSTVAETINQVSFSEELEDYLIFEIGSFLPKTPISEVREVHALALAQVLRAEHEVLSDDEVRDALAMQISYSPADRAIIDWNGAILFGTELEDVRAVLEFATLELLEFRVLDAKLDESLDRSYAALTQRKRYKADLRRIGQFQVDSAAAFEGVQNALKLLGDQYLARVYSLASNRFHLKQWDESIRRKLETIDSIYLKMSDRAATQRLEALEWVIIILIAVSIALELR